MITVEIPGVPDSLETVQIVSNENFVRAVTNDPGRIQYLSRLHTARVGEPPLIGRLSQLIQGAHQAFQHHLPFSLRPEVLWYAIVHEIAIHVKDDPDAHAKYFTSASQAEKETIEVRDDSLVFGGNNDWGRSIDLVRAPLRKKVAPETMKTFLPGFSTSDEEAETAILVAFMDVCSAYYKFKTMTVCGIPKVRLEGTAADWQLLADGAKRLTGDFPGLAPYFSDLNPILDKLAACAGGAALDMRFWESVYKYERRSGGSYINGWITAFFAHIPTRSGFRRKKIFDWESQAQEESPGGFTTDQFPAHVSSVEFTWQYHERNIPMTLLAGVLGTEYDDGFITPRLGFGVVEREA